MKINLNTIRRGLSLTGLKIKHHSPAILVVTGTIGVVASTVMACKATLKVNDVLNDTQNVVDTIHDAIELNEPSKYSEEDMKKDLAIVYVQTGVKLIKLYAPSVILGTLSIGCILTSHKILSKRNVALAAAYTTLDKGFKNYRANVVERFGEKIDKELKNNIKAKVIETVETNEDGTETVVKESVDICEGPSVYSKFFDEYSIYYKKDAEQNRMFLTTVQSYANEKLRRDGFLFLNDVYEMLDIPKTEAGHHVGWIYNEDDPNGDNYIDFGMHDVHRKSVREFVNGYEKAILLDFNVDGVIEHLAFDRTH